MKKFVTVFTALLAMTVGMQADAGFGDLANLKKGDAQDTSGVSQEVIVQKYAGAAAKVLQGQAELLDAFDLKSEAEAARAQADSMVGGATLTQDDLKKARAVSTDATAKYQEKINEGAELSEEGRGHYLNGLVLSAEGVEATRSLATEASQFGASAKQQISSASMLQKAKVTKKLAAGMFVAKELPGFTSELVENFGLLVSFAKSAEIPVPDDATALL